MAKDMIILGERIKLGETKTLNFSFAKLYTATKIEIPIIVNRSEIDGPTLLLTAGIHGDEINGVEIVRQVIAKQINKPKIGTTICIPILNIFFKHTEEVKVKTELVILMRPIVIKNEAWDKEISTSHNQIKKISNELRSREE